MSRGTSARLAWSLCALALVLTALSLLFLNLNLSHPGTHIYNYWLENMISVISLAPVGALVASADPETPWAGSCGLRGSSVGRGVCSEVYREDGRKWR